MAEFKIIALDADADFVRVRDLCDQAPDYVQLEEGRAPDDAYVRKTLRDAPPICRPEDIFLRGVERPEVQ